MTHRRNPSDAFDAHDLHDAHTPLAARPGDGSHAVPSDAHPAATPRGADHDAHGAGHEAPAPAILDDDFAHAFLSGALPPARFHHRDHLRLAWCLTRRHGVDDATTIITAGIRDFATQHGQAAKYHETLTRFWVRIVNHLARTRPDLTTFDAYLAAFPQLLDEDLPYRHWHRATMDSPAARAEWVEPDLLEMPA
ncbi:MAG TPA: hypothetical protein VIC85_14465 [Ktedonobacterales bacterium]